VNKHNLILSTAIAMAFGLTVSAANAGSLAPAVAGGTLFAAENMGSTTTATTGITPGAMTYTVGTTNGIVINAGGVIYFAVRLTSGTFASAPLLATVTGTALAVGGAGNGVVSNSILSTDKTTAMFAITYTAGVTLGVGSTLVYTPAALQVTGVNASLAAAGGSVTATASLSAITPVIVAPSLTTSPNTGTAQPADVDGPAGSAVIAKSAQAITTAISALPSDTAKIDLTATPPSSLYTVSTGTPIATTGITALGSVTFTNATTTPNQYDGATGYTIAAALAGVGSGVTKIVVTPGTGQAFPVGAVLSYDATDATCATPTGALAAFTAATSVTAATLTVANAGVTTAVPIYVCMTAPSATNVATPITPSITATLTGVVATDAKDTATGTGYALGYNGSQYDVRNYIPAAAAGYTSFVRVINTGAVSATVSVAVIDPVLGTAGTAAALTTLAPGAATTFSSTQIEAVTPAIASTTRPRLRFTAPTNGLNVQSFVLTNANGNFSDTTGAQ